jgi:YrbI family 3-deoxy-D-manno-octulosonate 8-phosphate phosphatase
MNKVKLFISDIDGTLTDSTIYYSKHGEELKQFSHKDGRGFYLLKHITKVKSFLITSEFNSINQARAKRFLKLGTIEKYYNGNYKKSKIDILFELCKQYDCHTDNIAYIGDDTNDTDCLKSVGYPACPWDAHKDILVIPNIFVTDCDGGQGAVRFFIDYLIENNLVYK